MARFVVGVSGASGVILAHRLIDVLTNLGHYVELVMTRDACLTALEEIGESLNSPHKFIESYSTLQRELINYHRIQDFSSPIASGSYLVDGMCIVPCSMATLAAIACGLSDNLLRRAADVTLKERRKLIIVPRESPLSDIHLENMLKLSRVGAVIVPPSPAWYTKPQTLLDVENFIVGKVLDALGVYTNIYPRWQGSTALKSDRADL